MNKWIAIATAAGLWANVAAQMFHAKPAAAQSDTQQQTLMNMAVDIGNAADDVSAIAKGTCTNSKICD